MQPAKIAYQVWWKVLAVLLVLYTIIGGFLIPVPALPILNESIRNLYFHVPMWFGMTIFISASMIYSILYLSRHELFDDVRAAACARVGLVFGVAGILTGSQWARVTWGAWWVNDPKLNAAAIGLLLYLGYFILRGSLDDIDKRARYSAVANIFMLAIFIPMIYIVPRLTDSLHPGNGGNPAFDEYDLDGNMRLVFYPAVIGWTLLGTWLINLNIRYERLKIISLFSDSIKTFNKKPDAFHGA
jgi:heme exporter protein C